MSFGEQAHSLSAVTESLRLRLGEDAVLEGQALAPYTALRIGGPADLMATVTSAGALQDVVLLCWDRGIPCHVLGAGSNVLVSDSGVRGLVILNRAREITFSGSSMKAESGAHISRVAHQSVKRGLAGLEWGVGIPGTLGGAIVGNAGAWGGDIASALVTARVLEQDGQTRDWPVERFDYGYRTSILKRQATSEARRAVVLDAEFALRMNSRETLEKRIAEITVQRKASQPPGASCGSVFKNPPGGFAGRLIEATGLKGYRRGEAEISTVHANFIINHGKATASDVKALIELARGRVESECGVTLELEIQLLGHW